MSDLERGIIVALVEKNDDLNKKIEQLEKKEKILRECVEYYSDTAKWLPKESLISQSVFYDGTDSEIMFKQGVFYGGKKARETLKSLEELK